MRLQQFHFRSGRGLLHPYGIRDLADDGVAILAGVTREHPGKQEISRQPVVRLLLL